MSERPMRDVALIAALAAAYFLAARAALAAHPVSGFASLVWPPSGIALAAILLFGRRMWPGIAAGAFFANLAQGAPAPVALCIAAGNSLEALAGAALLRRLPGFRASLVRMRDVIALAMVAAPLSTAIAATIGVSALGRAGIVAASSFTITWKAWWLGDVLGDLTVAPLLLVWFAEPRPWLKEARRIEAFGFLVVLVVVCLATFGVNGPRLSEILGPFLIYPLVAWAALRFGVRGGVSAAFVVSAVATACSLLGFGPFAVREASDGLFALQSFVATMMGMVLIAGAAQSERRATLVLLRRTQEELEERVRDRTAEYADANLALQREHERLVKSEERVRLLIEGVKDLAIIRLDPDGQVASWSAGAERLTGYKREEILGRHCECFYTAEDRAAGLPEAHLRLAAAAGRMEDQGWRVRGDGEKFWGHVIITAVRDESGRLTGFARVTRDRTQHKRAEESLRRAYEELELRVQDRTRALTRANAELQHEISERRQIERDLERRTRELMRSNAELEQFAYIASHDLQEPLRTVTSYSQLLARRYGDRLDDEAREFITYTTDAASWMHALLDDLLVYSKLGRSDLRVERLDLDSVLDQALANLHWSLEQSGGAVTRDPLPEVSGDRSQLVQLFQNLIGNALKFHGRTSPRIHIGVRRAGHWLRLSIRDNGIGIAPEHLNRIFLVFQRLHTREAYPGTGIGLAICKRIVERHGGRIRARSRPGHGSEFVFTLPAAPIPALSEPRAPADEPAGEKSAA